MKGYVIFQVTAVNDKEKINQYKEMAFPSIKAYGGKMIIRPGNIETVESDREVAYVFAVEFESYEKAQQWYHSPEYQACVEFRQGVVDCSGVIVEGV